MTLVEEIEQALKRCKYAAPVVVLACGNYPNQYIPDSYVFKGVEWELAYLNPGEKFRICWRHVGPQHKRTAEILAHSDRLRRSA